jgi:squalene cyclase
MTKQQAVISAVITKSSSGGWDLKIKSECPRDADFALMIAAAMTKERMTKAADSVASASNNEVKEFIDRFIKTRKLRK